MPDRRIVVHSCGRDRESGRACNCSEDVSLRRAKQLVQLGRAGWWKRRNANRGFVTVHDAIVMVMVPEVPKRHPLHGHTINAADVIRAYVEDDEYAAGRIEEFDPRK